MTFWLLLLQSLSLSLSLNGICHLDIADDASPHAPRCPLARRPITHCGSLPGTALLRFCPAAADEPEVSEGGAAATQPQPAAPAAAAAAAAAAASSPVPAAAVTSAGEANAAEAAPLAAVGGAELSLLDRWVRVEIMGLLSRRA
jgi:hypothetical protein